jgi:plastocyanin
MTSRWLICFSVFSVAIPLYPASVSGQVELRDSKDPAVKKRHDFSGVVVSLKPVPGPAPAPQHRPHATITQKDKTFSPHVLAIPLGTYVDFPNVDPIFHNAFSSYSGQVFDVGLYPPGTSRSVLFRREGVVRVFCNIHSSMSAMIVVLATPYFAVSKRDGSFEMAGVPPGDYEMRVVHERSGEAALQSLTRRMAVGSDPLILPSITVSEAGYLSIPHKDKYGHDYAPEPGSNVLYPGAK